MSRIGKIPVQVPKEVKIQVAPGNVHLEGAKGKLDLSIPSDIQVEQNSDQLLITRRSNSKQSRSNHGTIRARLVNMIKGVAQGHRRDLEISGLGFRVALAGKKLQFVLGFSHPVEYDVPGDIKVVVNGQTSISLEGADLEKLGLVAAKIKALKPVEPYKGKGIRYAGQYVRRKQGKAVTK